VFIPTYGEVLRFALNRRLVGLQFVPAIAGGVWALWYFWTRRNRWDWMDQGLIVLFITDVCAPYGYFTDECIVFPFVLAALYRAMASGRSWVPLTLINFATLIEAYAQVNIISPWYLWTPLAWLVWYLYGSNGRTKEEQPVKA
jgi:hypothetical protein